MSSWLHSGRGNSLLSDTFSNAVASVFGVSVTANARTAATAKDKAVLPQSMSSQVSHEETTTTSSSSTGQQEEGPSCDAQFGSAKKFDSAGDSTADDQSLSTTTTVPSTLSSSGTTVFNETKVHTVAFAVAEEGVMVSDPESKKKKKAKKKGTPKNGVKVKTFDDGATFASLSSRSSHCSTMTSLRSDFMETMAEGVCLKVATSVGVTRSVTLTINDSRLLWGPPGANKLLTLSISEIDQIILGLPSNLVDVYKSSDNECAFHIATRNTLKPVSFIAGSGLERDAIIRGFKSLI
jgi:hypothetical protein